MTHPNAALTPRHRLKVARLVVDDGWPISEVAARFQVSWPTVKRWVERYHPGFDGVLKFVWHAKQTQVYPELKRLAADGLIREQGEGPRGRRPYEITEDGLTELRQWLTVAAPDHSLRNETVLRSFALWLVEPEEAREFLSGELEYHRARLRGMRVLKQSLDLASPADRAALLGLEAGIRRLEAMISWAEWAIETVATWPSREEQASA